MISEEVNPYRHIEFFPATGKFRVTLPDSRCPQAKYPVFDDLQEAMKFRDQIFAEYEANTGQTVDIDPRSPFKRRHTRTMPPSNQAIERRESLEQELKTA